MPQNYEIISSLLAMFIVALSIYGVGKITNLFSTMRKNRRFKSFVKNNQKIEVLCCDKNGTPTVIKVNGAIKVM